MSSSPRPLKKILWALDPFAELPTATERAEQVIGCLATGGQVSVQPVNVLGVDNLNWVGNVTAPQIEKFVPITEKAMAKKVSSSALKNLEPPKVLVNERNSKREDIAALMNFAKVESADLLVLNTHARKGVERIFLGSFAETALMQATLPVVTVSPDVSAVTTLEKVLFPTDFSEYSKFALTQFCEQMKGIVKEVVIYNKIPHPVDAFIQTGVATIGGGWVSVEEFMDTESSERQKLADELSKIVQASGMSVSANIDNGPGQVAESVVQAAKEAKANMIAMSAESGAFATFMIGSVARHVIRHAEVPVWVDYRPN